MRDYLAFIPRTQSGRLHAAITLVMMVVVMLVATCTGGGASGCPNCDTPTPLPPAAPQYVQAQGGDKHVSLSWSAVSGADAYNVYYRTQAGVTKANGVKLGNQTSPTVVSNLNNGTTYYFIVTSLNSVLAQESAASNEVFATPQPLLGDTAPLTGAATAVTGNSAILNGSFTNPAGYTTTVWFEYGLTTNYGSVTASSSYLQAGNIVYSKQLVSLAPMTVFHFRLVTQNSGGVLYGQDQQFTTSASPVTLLSDLDAPVGLPFDGTSLYWMEVYSGHVRKMNVNNNTSSVIASNMAFGGNSGCIAIDNTYIYLADGAHTIRRMNLDGSGLNNNFSTAALSAPSQMIAHPTGLYIRDEWYDAGANQYHQYISRISLDGLTRTQLFERPGNSPGGVSGFGGGMVLDSNYLYWTDYYNNNIQRLPISGGTPVTIASSINRPDQLLLDGANLYVSHGDGISKIDLNLGTMAPLVSTPLVPGGYMAKDTTGLLYILTPTEIRKLDVNTGAITTMAIGNQGFTSTPVVTPSNLYWITAGSHFYPPLGTLKQVTKP